MAPPAGTLRVGRYFLALLAVLAVLYAIVFIPGTRHTPKLGLDLEGGSQVIFKAQTLDGKTPSKSAMSEAKDIMTQRVNGSGVAEATVVIQGTDELVVSIPGKGTDLSKLGEAAQLNFRPLIMAPVAPAAVAAGLNSGATTAPTTGATTPAASGAATTPAASTPAASSAPVAKPTATSTAKSAQDAEDRPLAAATTPAVTAKAAATAKASATPTAKATTPVKATTPAKGTPVPSAAATPTTPAVPPTSSDPLKNIGFTVPLSEADYAKLTPDQQTKLQAAVANYKCDTTGATDNPKSYLLACDDKTNPQVVYLLAPVIVPGTEISSASAQQASSGGTTTGGWVVVLNLKSTGQANWAKYTTANNTGGQTPSTSITECGASATPCADYVAFTLDGTVISAPSTTNAINGGSTQISGGFTQSTASDLADQLKYGALPLSFTAESTQQVSPTLGSSQLKAGLLAGGIGLALVIIYSLLYYRGLGLVTIASLVVSGVLTWACLVILGREIDFTLTLAGIAGFIVAIGITADSFVVFFERIKDEVHEGRSMRTAVPRAWVRARRTILSADTVSFLAAAVLYYFAAGDVKGFAFTLGLSTILDLVVVFLFTHPIVSLLSRSRAFGSARFTGLNAVREHAVATPDELAGPARSARPAPPTEPARNEPRTQRKAAVVLLDKDEEIIEADAVAEEPTRPAKRTGPRGRAKPTPQPTDAEAIADDATDGVDAADAPEPPTQAGPLPGTAAERAAARRARLRDEKKDGK